MKSSNTETTKQTILDMSHIVAEYARLYEVSTYRATLEIMKVDSRFQGSFDEAEIGIILGITSHKVKATLMKTLRVLSSPKKVEELRLYTETETSDHQSDF